MDTGYLKSGDTLEERAAEQGLKIEGTCVVSCESDRRVVSIPDGITAIGENAFKEHPSIEAIEIPKSVVHFGKCAFSNARKLKAVNYYGTIEDWFNIDFERYSNPTMELARLFINNTEISEVCVPLGITEIKSDTFNGCKSLTKLIIPRGVTKICDHAVNRCGGIKEIILPDTVTEIGNRAFYNCSGLKRVVIPKSVKRIGDEAFDYCFSLNELTVYGSTEYVGERLFGSTYGRDKKPTLTVKGSKKDTKKWNGLWQRYEYGNGLKNRKFKVKYEKE